MLLMVQKGIRRGICHTIHQYVKPNNKYIKNYDKNKESSCLKYLIKWFVWLGNVAETFNV